MPARFRDAQGIPNTISKEGEKRMATRKKVPSKKPPLGPAVVKSMRTSTPVIDMDGWEESRQDTVVRVVFIAEYDLNSKDLQQAIEEVSENITSLGEIIDIVRFFKES